MTAKTADYSRPAYEAEEARRFRRQLDDVETAPLADRQDARRAWDEALRDSPELVADRIGWLLNGSYGYGAYMTAGEVVVNRRMNRQAWLGQTIAALQWGCPGNFAREVWKKLDRGQKDRLDELIEAEIDDHLAEREKKRPLST